MPAVESAPPLHRITVYLETGDERTVDELCDAIKSAICPFPDAEPHECPNRWMIIASEMPEDEVRELGDLDVLLNST